MKIAILLYVVLQFHKTLARTRPYDEFERNYELQRNFRNVPSSSEDWDDSPSGSVETRELQLQPSNLIDNRNLDAALPKVLKIIDDTTKTKSPNGPINLNIIVVPIVHEELASDKGKSDDTNEEIEILKGFRSAFPMARSQLKNSLGSIESSPETDNSGTPAPGIIPTETPTCKPVQCDPMKERFDHTLCQCVRKRGGSSPIGGRRRQVG